MTMGSRAELEGLLREAGVDLSPWGRGQAKTIDDLWREIRAGEARIRPGPLREVAVVRVLVRRGPTFLLEISQELPGGRVRRRGQPPSEKMLPGESWARAALRCLVEEIGVEPPRVAILSHTHRIVRERVESFSYPGLATEYVMHTVEARVAGLPNGAFSTEERDAPGDLVRVHRWDWGPDETRPASPRD